jgi:hypothetical protein
MLKIIPGLAHELSEHWLVGQCLVMNLRGSSRRAAPSHELVRSQRRRRLACTMQAAMAEKTINTDTYKLFPSPRNAHREVFVHEVFVPHPYALIDLPSFRLQGKYSLFAAYRLADARHGQLVTFELAADADKFNARFVPD